METVTQNRLKAFLDRNRSRISATLTTEKDDSFPLITMSTPTDYENKNNFFNFGETNSTYALSYRLPREKDQHTTYGTPGGNFMFTTDRNISYSENQTPNQEERQTTDFTAYDSPSKSERLPSITVTPPGNKTQREVAQTVPTCQDEETERGRKNYSSSPVRVRENKSAKNHIENFLASKKKAENKIIRENIRSLSRDQKKIGIHLKTKSSVSTYQSTTPRIRSGSTGSDVLESHRISSARRSLLTKSSNKESVKVEKNQIKPQQMTKSPRNVNNKIFSSGIKKPKEERHEFMFEEAPALNKGVKTARSISKSREPSRPTSLTPRGVRAQEKKQQVPQQQKKERSLEKSPAPLDNHKKNYFPESSRRLKTMDEEANNESKFKKEIKKLIHIIKQEKEQISQDLEIMAKELNKYKVAYKKLVEDEIYLWSNYFKKKQFQQQKEFTTPRNDENSIPFAETPNNTNNSRPNSVACSNEGEKPSDKRDVNIMKKEDINTPFTIDELTKHFDSNFPLNIEEDQVELISKMKNINSDIETIMMKNLPDHALNKDSNCNLNFETHSFVLRKNAINCYIIKEMNLASHIFFKDTIKEFEEDQNFKPTVIDLLAAQREIIHFLIRKLEIEEKQRLKTEEQASKMMTQMEKTIKQMDERGSVSRKKESPSTTELNKSIISQN